MGKSQEMAQPPITKLDVAAGDSIYDAEAAINTLIDQSVKNVGMSGGQLVTVETQDGTNIQFFIPQARNGINSGCEFSWTGALAAEVAAGNFQGDGLTESLSVLQVIAFTARHATLPRIDIVYADCTVADTVAVLAGTPASSPVIPDLSLVAGTNAPLYYVWIDSVAAATARDFVIAACEANPTLPICLGMELDGQAIKANFPLKKKGIDYSEVTELLNADRILVDCSAGAVTIPLPDPASVAEREWVFIDSTGNAPANNIDLDATAAGAFTVNGAGSFTISTAYGQATLYCNGIEYYAR